MNCYFQLFFSFHFSSLLIALIDVKLLQHLFVKVFSFLVTVFIVCTFREISFISDIFRESWRHFRENISCVFVCWRCCCECSYTSHRMEFVKLFLTLQFAGRHGVNYANAPLTITSKLISSIYFRFCFRAPNKFRHFNEQGFWMLGE